MWRCCSVVTTPTEVDVMTHRQRVIDAPVKLPESYPWVAQEYKSCLLSGCVVFHAGERGEEGAHREYKKRGNITTSTGEEVQ